MYIRSKVIPISYYDIEFACARTKDLLIETAKRQVDLLARAQAINTCGIINFY